MVLTNNNTMGILSKQTQVQSQIWALDSLSGADKRDVIRFTDLR